MAKQMREEEPVINPTEGRIYYDDEGREMHDKSGGYPAAALRITQRDNLGDLVQRAVARELIERAKLDGYETFDEADDFDVGEDFDPTSPYEHFFEGDMREDAKKLAEAQREKLKTLKSADLVKLLKELDPSELQGAMSQLPEVTVPTPAPSEPKD